MVAALACRGGFLATVLPGHLVENYCEGRELGVVINTVAGVGAGGIREEDKGLSHLNSMGDGDGGEESAGPCEEREKGNSKISL